MLVLPWRWRILATPLSSLGIFQSVVGQIAAAKRRMQVTNLYVT